MTEKTQDHRKRRYLAEWLFMGASIVLMLAIFANFHHAEYKAIEINERERLQGQVAILAKSLELRLSSLWRASDALISDYRSNSSGKQGVVPNTNHLKFISDSLLGVRTILITDDKGKVVSSNRTELIGFDSSKRAQFVSALNSQSSQTLFVSPPFKTILNAYVISLSRRIVDRDGVFRGALVLSVDPAYFNILLQPVLSTADTRAAIAHGDGQVFTLLPDGGQNTDRWLAQASSTVRLHLASGMNSSVFSGPVANSDERRLVAISSVFGSEMRLDKALILGVSRDLDSLYADWRRDFVLDSGLLLSLVLVVAFSLFAYQKRERVYERNVDTQEKHRLIAEQERRTHEANFRAVFEQAAVGVAQVDTLSGRFLRVNRKYAEILGYSEAEMLGMDFMTITHPDDLANDLVKLRELKEGLIPDFELEMRLVQKTGHLVWIKLTVSPLWKRGESPGRHIAVVQDISAKKQIEFDLQAAKQVAEEANRTKSRFLAAASHDLRQPIQAMNLFHSALERTELNGEQLRLTKYLERSMNSLSELLNALLDISRLESGVVQQQPVVILASELFEKLNNEFSPVASAKPLRFKLYFPQHDIFLRTDLSLLLSLLRNLIGNAIKYTPEGGGILVSIRRRGTDALVQVWDTGIGISVENIDRIFDAYFQVENPARDREKGLGLGLSIVQLIANLIETRVICRSRVGQGTVFEFRLPILDKLKSEVSGYFSNKLLDDSALFAARGYRITVVDDDVLVARSMTIALESVGMSVRAFTSAEEALASDQVLDSDFYISDFRLPGINGIQLLEAIEARSNAPIRAFLLTGDGTSGRVGLTELSKWPVLYKPIELEALLAAMRQY